MIKRYWTGLKRWFSYFKLIISIYDFDYTSILLVEKYQITRVKNYIAKYGSNYYGYEYDIKWINKALACLNIVLEDGSVKVVNNKWVLPYYVNVKNCNRFCKYKCLDSTLFLDDLRITKAWTLYNKIRNYHLKRWWY